MARLSAASRLPPAIVRRIVQYTCHLIWSAGGASVSTMLPDYNRLRSVCWGWMEYVNEVHIHLDMLDLLTRRLNFDGSSIDMNKTLQGLMKIRKGSHFRRGKSYCPRQILAISLDSIEGKSWKERKEKGVKSGFESLFVQFNLVKKLHLEIECGGDIELASKFPSLTHLYVISWEPPNQARLSLGSPSSSPRKSPALLPPTLVRLDLSCVAINEWNSTLPALKVLTMSHVAFGKDDKTDSTERAQTCRQFFGSFPSLESIAFNGILRLTSDALTRLKVIGITDLYVGPCSVHPSGANCSAKNQDDARSFVQALARHFRCRIKHLYFKPKMCPCIPPQFCNIVPLRELLESRSGERRPPYLAKLETLTVAPPREQHESVDWPCGVEWEEWMYRQDLEKAGLSHVEVKRWRVGEKGKLVQWEPKLWC